MAMNEMRTRRPAGRGRPPGSGRAAGPRGAPRDGGARPIRRSVRPWFTPPVVALGGSLLVFALLGGLGVAPWDDWQVSVRWALAAMFLLTASARLGPRAAQLRAMVPPWLPRPDIAVNVSGLLEALGAIGLLIPATALPAAWCLTALLLALFPANVYAARRAARFGGGSATPLPIRTAQQLLFVACAVLAAL